MRTATARLAKVVPVQLQITQSFNQTFEEFCFLEGKGKKEENTMFHLHKVWGQNLKADLPDLKNDLKKKHCCSNH